MFFPEKIKNILPTDNVLEIGPGATPYFRSDVLLEKKFSNKEEFDAQNGYSGQLITSKEVVYYEGDIFPFKDKEFDYVICSHVLEHVYDIDLFINEIIRVGKKGYIEFPTIYYDYLYNFDVHLTFLLHKDNVIFWLPKTDTSIHQFITIQHFFYKSLEKNYTSLVDDLKEFIFQGFEWDNILVSKRVKSIDKVCYNLKNLELPIKVNYSIKPKNAFSINFFRILRIQKKLYKSIFTNLKKIKNKFFQNDQSIFNKENKEFYNDYDKFQVLSNSTQKRFQFNKKDLFPCLSDKTHNTDFDIHYIYHTAWAARILKKINPLNHVDISSSLYFCSIVSAFVPIEFYDYRPANIKLSNLNTQHADLSKLTFKDNTIQSLSCMHTVEHIGLGRYGDPLDYDADLKAIRELKRVLKPEGDLLFVVPIGKPKIMFNAHRIYSYEQVISYFKDLSLHEFSLIPDNGVETGIIENARQEFADIQTYGCGCFWFKKI